MNIMGKRVLNSARSVIAPDPFLKTFEVGVPKEFAKDLYVPESINLINILKVFLDFLKIKNFKKKKLILEILNGNKISISQQDFLFKLKKISISYKYFKLFSLFSKNKYGFNKFLRNLKKNDISILNRQPSLHKTSIMAHKVRILKSSKCLKLHYSNCNSYNADFDGDEMNLHIPQNYLSISESLYIAYVTNQNTIPSNGLPLRGLIQDQIISGVLLTKKDTFFNKNCIDIFLSNVFSNKERDILELPSIIKPNFLWTGKQIFSILCKTNKFKQRNFFLETKTKLPSSIIGSDENRILFRKGILLKGVIDSSQLGRNKFGFFHAFYENFGSVTGDTIMSRLSIFFSIFQVFYNHSCSLQDFFLKTKMEKKLKNIYKLYSKLSLALIKKSFSIFGLCIDSRIIEENSFYKHILSKSLISNSNQKSVILTKLQKKLFKYYLFFKYRKFYKVRS
mmetsp:Transcript_42252/g.133114  ORF Transcript_42252/g.133114 Transcript_42252/m.133114 type:complete len:451 (+) Transcript_42252:1363-2715(+)